VQPVKENVPVRILIGTDQDWSLLPRLKNTLSDALHHFGINGFSPFYRDVNLVDRDVFWLAHDHHAKAGDARRLVHLFDLTLLNELAAGGAETSNRRHSILTANGERIKATEPLSLLDRHRSERQNCVG
jgi:hypothetical protein